MRRIKTILKSLRLPSSWEGLGVGCLPSSWKGLGVGFVFFTLHSSLFTLTSCSSELENPGTEEKKVTAIAFNGKLTEEEVTRATTPLEEYTKAFKVWAYKSMSFDDVNGYGSTQTVMDQYHVQWVTNTANTTTTNSNDWDYILMTHPEQSIKYWDFGAEAYRFFGSAEMSATPGTWEHITEGTECYKYTCTADATNAEDAPFYTHLWFSNGNAETYPTRQYGQLVTLEFIKPFAEVVFKFTLADPNADPKPMLEEPDFRPQTAGRRIALMGDVKITFPLAGTATQESWESTPEYTKFLTAFTKTDTQYTVFPIRGQGAYRLTVTVNGADKDCTVPAQYMTWSPGYRYTYIFKVNDEGGVELDNVNIAVKNWQEDAETTAQYNLYNW